MKKKITNKKAKAKPIKYEKVAVLLAVDCFSNGRKQAEDFEDAKFSSVAEILRTIIPDYEDSQLTPVIVYELSDFMDEANTQEINFENYWVTFVNIDEKHKIR